jgi:cell division septation protein DedD
LKDIESSIKENYQRILHPELMEDAVTPKRASTKMAYWFTAVLAVLFLGSSLFLNIQKSTTYQNQSSLLPAFEKAVVTAAENKTEIPATEPAAVKTEETVKTQAVPTPVKSSKNKAYIVIGAFFDEIRANKMKTEAESKGYVVNISKDNSNGLFRTTVQVENSEVETALQKVKSEINSRAWVYCVKCNLY